MSNLSSLSKVVETCMLKQFNRHCTDNHLFPDYQSAYGHNYSCETALVKLINNILWSMEQQHITALVAIDLSATFDTDDITILLKILQSKFGITDTALEWLGSYIEKEAAQLSPPYIQYMQVQYKKSFCKTPIQVLTQLLLMHRQMIMQWIKNSQQHHEKMSTPLSLP